MGDVAGAETGIDIEVAEIDITGPQGVLNPRLLRTAATGTADAGDIRITADRLTVESAKIESLSIARGDAGDVVVQVETLRLTAGAQINSDTFSAGNAGQITVTATDSVTMEGGDDVAEPNGDIAPNGLDSRAGNNSSGNAGTITLTAPTVTMALGGIATIAFHGSSGRAGDIRLAVGTLTMTRAGRIVSQTFGSGLGGTITIIATGTVTIRGDLDEQGFRSGLSSSSRGSGNAGNIILTAPTLRVENEGLIIAESDGRFVSTERAGNAGDITVEVGQLILTGGGGLNTTTRDTGSGGIITVTADSITIRGIRDQQTDPGQSGIFSEAEGSGRVGEIRLQTREIQLMDGAQISARSTGTGNAGEITITVLNTFVSENRGSFKSQLTVSMKLSV